jgi:hypothetical protein
MTRLVGRKVWAIPGGYIPLKSNGVEPDFTSHDKVCILNATHDEATLEITFFYTDRDPIGPYSITVGARRVKHVRVNDLIDPEAVPLNTDYACLIEANVPVVVQFTHQDTRQAENAIFSSLAFPVD